MDRDLASTARGIIDSSLYMTLGTADEEGQPWVSPVFFAADRYREFFWISSPEVTHSRNISARPQVSIVVFDSRVPAGTGQGVYMSATAAALAGEELEHGLEVYPGSAKRGGRTMTPKQVQPPGHLPPLPGHGVAALDALPTAGGTTVCPARTGLRPPHRGRALTRAPRTTPASGTECRIRRPQADGGNTRSR